MTDQPDEPLDISKIRKDDADLDAASEGTRSDDPLLDLLGRWAETSQEDTSHPTRKER